MGRSHWAGRYKWSESRAAIDADPMRRAERDRYAREMATALAVASLAEVRQARGLTQVVVAERLGLSQTRMSTIENGDDLQLTTLERYVEALGGRLRVEAVFPDTTIDLGGAPDEPAAGIAH